jgi:branched-chain amino acid transport system substrate-binding protein
MLSSNDDCYMNYKSNSLPPTTTFAIAVALTVFLLGYSPKHVGAQTKTTSTCDASRPSLLIGQTIPLTGVVAEVVSEVRSGSQLYLNAVNKSGGVAGRCIKLEVLDDGSDAKRGLANAEQLVKENQVLALFTPRGTPTSEALLPLVVREKVAIIGPQSGAYSLHEPFNSFVFNIRANYRQEAAELIKHLNFRGTKRIAIVHVDDVFGKDALVGALATLSAIGLRSTGLYSYERTASDFGKLTTDVLTSDADAVVIIGSAKPVAKIVKGLKEQKPALLLATLSNNAATAFVKDVGVASRGLIISQVVPSPWRATPLALEYRNMATEANEVISFAGMEGFVAAKVLVEGLRRAGVNPTRSSLILALQRAGNLNLGGMSMRFGPNQRSGSSYVQLSIVDSNGKMQQ